MNLVINKYDNNHNTKTQYKKLERTYRTENITVKYLG